MSIATKAGEWSSDQRPSSTSRNPRRSGLRSAARETSRQNASIAARAAGAPPLAWPSTSTAAFIAPAEVPEMPSIRSQGSSSSRSRAPQVKAPCAPPPCSAKSTSRGSRADLSAFVVAIGVDPSCGQGDWRDRSGWPDATGLTRGPQRPPIAAADRPQRLSFSGRCRRGCNPAALRPGKSRARRGSSMRTDKSSATG